MASERACARRHASPRPRLRSHGTASPSPASAAQRSQIGERWSGAAPRAVEARPFCQARAPVPRAADKIGPQRARVWDVGRRGAHAARPRRGLRGQAAAEPAANSASVAPVERFARRARPLPDHGCCSDGVLPQTGPQSYLKDLPQRADMAVRMQSLLRVFPERMRCKHDT